MSSQVQSESDSENKTPNLICKQTQSHNKNDDKEFNKENRDSVPYSRFSRASEDSGIYENSEFSKDDTKLTEDTSHPAVETDLVYSAVAINSSSRDFRVIQKGFNRERNHNLFDTQTNTTCPRESVFGKKYQTEDLDNKRAIAEVGDVVKDTENLKKLEHLDRDAELKTIISCQNTSVSQNCLPSEGILSERHTQDEEDHDRIKNEKWLTISDEHTNCSSSEYFSSNVLHGNSTSRQPEDSPHTENGDIHMSSVSGLSNSLLDGTSGLYSGENLENIGVEISSDSQSDDDTDIKLPEPNNLSSTCDTVSNSDEKDVYRLENNDSDNNSFTTGYPRMTSSYEHNGTETFWDTSQSIGLLKDGSDMVDNVAAPVDDAILSSVYIKPSEQMEETATKTDRDRIVIEQVKFTGRDLERDLTETHEVGTNTNLESVRDLTEPLEVGTNTNLESVRDLTEPLEVCTNTLSERTVSEVVEKPKRNKRKRKHRTVSSTRENHTDDICSNEFFSVHSWKDRMESQNRKTKYLNKSSVEGELEEDESYDSAIGSSLESREFLQSISDVLNGKGLFTTVKSKTNITLSMLQKECSAICKKRDFGEKDQKDFLRSITRHLYVSMGQEAAVFGLSTYFNRLNAGEQLGRDEQLHFEWLRFITFQNYQGEGSAIALARNGFVHDETAGPNAVRCIFCRIQYSHWTLLDDVEQTHRLMSPTCPIHGSNWTGDRNVTIDDDYSGGNSARVNRLPANTGTGRTRNVSDASSSSDLASSSAAKPSTTSVTSGSSTKTSGNISAPSTSSSSTVDDHLFANPVSDRQRIQQTASLPGQQQTSTTMNPTASVIYFYTWS